MSKSKFGCGLCYCLGLFLCHSERDNLLPIRKNIDTALWFNMSGDHLFELQIPESLPKSLQTRLKKFQSKILTWKLPLKNKKNLTEKDKIWAIQEAKDLLRLIDKHFDIKTRKGDCE